MELTAFDLKLIKYQFCKVLRFVVQRRVRWGMLLKMSKQKLAQCRLRYVSRVVNKRICPVDSRMKFVGACRCTGFRAVRRA